MFYKQKLEITIMQAQGQISKVNAGHLLLSNQCTVSATGGYKQVPW